MSGWLLVVLLLVLVYVGLKLYEYGWFVDFGLDIEYDIFFIFYWCLIGFYFFYVLFGLLIFGWLV